MKYLIATLIILFTTPALACPLLESATPKVGSEVSGDIGSVSLEFSSKIYPEKSTVSVTDGKGNAVNTGAPYGQAGNDRFIATHVKPLSPGKYKVKWNVFCDCGNLNPGDFKFTVKETIYFNSF